MGKITKQQYEFALKRVEELLPLVDETMSKNDPKVVELSMMSDIVIDYEKEHLPIEYSETNSHPYIDSNSKEYFESLKNNDIDTFIELTFKNKFLLLNNDYSHETVLHVMAKRNIYLFISFAIRNGGNPNSKNYIGRTPLH